MGGPLPPVLPGIRQSLTGHAVASTPTGASSHPVVSVKRSHIDQFSRSTSLGSRSATPDTADTVTPATASAGLSSRSELEDELRSLRAEVARYQTEAINAARRPMPGIAGGGFRGSRAHTTCECETLRIKLMRCRAMLQGSRSELASVSRQSRVAESFDECASLELVDCSVQVETFGTVDVALQASVPLSICAKSTQAGVVPSLQDSSVQTTTAANEVQVSDACAQCAPMDYLCQASSQTEIPGNAEACLQTETIGQNSVGLQAGCPEADLRMQAVQAGQQIEHASVEVQATDCSQEERSRSAQPELVSREAQTSPPPACEAATTQTLAFSSPRRSIAVQAVPRHASLHMSVQTEEIVADDRALKLANSTLEAANARIAELEGQCQELSAEVNSLKEDLSSAKQAVQTRAFGQMHVTVVCPRAECNMYGERIEVDGWNPEAIRAEIEREVIPHFTRIWMSEDTEEASVATKAAIDASLKEFANTFRDKLSAMLRVPAVSSAVDASSASGASGAVTKWRSASKQSSHSEANGSHAIARSSGSSHASAPLGSSALSSEASLMGRNGSLRTSSKGSRVSPEAWAGR